MLADRAAVLAVAHALETHETMQGEDVVAVIERRRGPLVDGRIYADPGFAREVEAYHRSAAAAHRDRSQVQLSLPPVLTGSAGPAGDGGPRSAVAGSTDSEIPLP